MSNCSIGIIRTVFISVSSLFFCSCASENMSTKAIANPFYALDTATRDANHSTAEDQCRMLQELGYDGIGCRLNSTAQMLEELDKTGLKLFTVYCQAHIDPGMYRYEPQLKRVITQLKGRETVIWLMIQSDKYGPSYVPGDAEAVKLIEEVADMAAQSGLKVALYPHTNCWLERVDDAVRLVKKVGRENVGVTFNLCHWLRVEGPSNLRPLMESAAPYLLEVTINGADQDAKDWQGLIQTLDRGSYDTFEFLKTLRQVGYTGPIGFQGYGIKGDVHDNLKRSIQAWRRLCDRAASRKTDLLSSSSLIEWREPTGEWKVVGEVFKNPNDERRLSWKPGTGVIVNGIKGRTCYLATKIEHGDVKAHIEFMVPKGSNSGVYFMGRYEIQVLDSWGAKPPKYSDCGGIYQRWDQSRTPKGYEGHAPKVNASRAPGKWQSFDVIFRAPRFDSSGEKIANARFEKVVHNNKVIHENVEVTGPTRASAYHDERPTGPIVLQGDHGPVAYRNIRIKDLTE